MKELNNCIHCGWNFCTSRGMESGECLRCLKKLEKLKIDGVASEEKVINDNGGSQSKLGYRFDLIDTKAIFALANVLHTGEQEYGKDNWRKIDTEDHLNHALSHAYAFLAGDQQDDHLSHCFCRLMMAIGVDETKKAR